MKKLAVLLATSFLIGVVLALLLQAYQPISKEAPAPLPQPTRDTIIHLPQLAQIRIL